MLINLTLIRAQYNTNQNKTWIFGLNSGLNFNTSPPTPITKTINTSEGNASVSDASGALLFYTDGTNVYDNTGTLMTGGSLIVPYSWGTPTTTQAAIIMPVIGSTTKYYIFSLGSLGYNNLAYSIVDMGVDAVTLAGDVLITGGISEKMTAVAGNDCNIWLILHDRDDDVFIEYDITSTGISTTPVTYSFSSGFSGINAYQIGAMTVSPDRTRIALASTLYGTELCDFDPATGIISNSRILSPTPETNYGIEFSSNSTKLYTDDKNTGDMYQYDVSPWLTTSEIISTKTIIGAATTTLFKLAPNDMIYFSDNGLGSSYLDCISSPNTIGIGCGYISHAVELLTSTQVLLGLPDIGIVNTPSDPITGVSSVCAGQTVTLYDATSGGTWSSANPAV